LKTTEDTASELLTAAAALSEGLRRFGDLTNALRQTPLTSQKKLNRAAALFHEVGEAEAELGKLVQGMVAAFQNARALQETWIASLQTCAETYQARSELLQGLLQDYAAIGASAGELSVHVQAAASASGAEDTAARLADLADILMRVEALLERIRTFSETCIAQDFQDLGQLANGLRSQLQGARKQLTRLVRRPDDDATGDPEALAPSDAEHRLN
jgi:hypothetical protein